MRLGTVRSPLVKVRLGLLLLSFLAPSAGAGQLEAPRAAGAVAALLVRELRLRGRPQSAEPRLRWQTAVRL